MRMTGVRHDPTPIDLHPRARIATITVITTEEAFHPRR